MATKRTLTKNEILAKYCKDLQALDAEHALQVARLEEERLERVGAIAGGRRLVEAAEAARHAAAAELSTDRERAASARDAAQAAAAEKRRGAFAANEQTWRRAELAAERRRDDDRTDEARKHEDALAKIAKTQPLHQQAIPRAEEMTRHEEALSRIQADFDTAWDRARQDLQAANESALQAEQRASESANGALQEAVRLAELRYRTTLDATESKLHAGLLEGKETRPIEEGIERRGLEIRQQWEDRREALHARFKKDYDSAPRLMAAKRPPSRPRRRA